MKVNVETLSSIEKKLSIELDAERVAKEIDRAYKGLARQVRVPGFRQGKVPRRILEARYKDQVEQEVLQSLVSLGYREAVDSHDLFPVGNPVVSPEKLEQGKPFKFEARVEVKPEVEAKDWKGLEYEPAKAEVTDKMVDDELERLRDQLAQLVPIEDRKAALEGDYASIDFVGTVDGKEFGGGKGEGVTVEVTAQGSLLEGNAPFLKGVAVGDTVSADVEFPPDHRAQDLRGKKAVFQVTLKALKKREVPALDDELAKDLGGEAKTLEELKAQIRGNLEKGEQDRAERETRERLLAALVARHPLEVPKALVERSIDLMMSGAAERFARQGLDIRQLGLDFKRLREDLRSKATDEVKAALLLEAISRQEKLEIEEKDLDAHYAKIAADAGVPEAKVRAHFKDPDERRGLESRLREDKAVELVKREAKPKA